MDADERSEERRDLWLPISTAEYWRLSAEQRSYDGLRLVQTHRYYYDGRDGYDLTAFARLTLEDEKEDT